MPNICLLKCPFNLYITYIFIPYCYVPIFNQNFSLLFIQIYQTVITLWETCSECACVQSSIFLHMSTWKTFIFNWKSTESSKFPQNIISYNTYAMHTHNGSRPFADSSIIHIRSFSIKLVRYFAFCLKLVWYFVFNIKLVRYLAFSIMLV